MRQQRQWFCRKACVPFIQGHCKHVWQCHVVLYTRSSSAYNPLTHKEDFDLQIVSNHLKKSHSDVGQGMWRTPGLTFPFGYFELSEKWLKTRKKKWQNLFNITQKGIVISTFNLKNTNFNITWSTNDKYKECQKPWPHRIFLLLRSLKQWKSECFINKNIYSINKAQHLCGLADKSVYTWHKCLHNVTVTKRKQTPEDFFLGCVCPYTKSVSWYDIPNSHFIWYSHFSRLSLYKGTG